jgi:hypothetical protein
MKYCTPFIIFILFLLTLNTGLAAELDINSLKAQQEQLQSLLNDIDKASEQRQQHAAQISRLKHQLECNWTLIRSYENCGRLYENDLQEHLKCSSSAKRTAAKCLNSAPQK